MSVLCPWLLVLGSYILFMPSVVAAVPKKIPVGAIFDETSLLAQTAFRSAIKKNNDAVHEGQKKEFPFKLDISKHRISIAQVGNCFNLSTSICNQMARGIFVLFGVTNVSTLSTIESYSRTFHMPYITPGATKKSTGDNFQLRMRPSYTKAMIELIKYYKWKEIHYIYDSDEGLSRLQQLYEHFNDEDTQLKIDVQRLKDVDNSYGVLRRLDNRCPNKNKYIVLDLSSDEAQKSIFRQIQNVGMNRASYHYLLGGLGMPELDLEDFRHGGVNITGFRLVDPNRYKVQLFQRMWNTLDPSFYRGAGPDSKNITYEVALLDDAVTAFVKAINVILKKNPDAFKLTFRRGDVYNNNSKGVQCYSDPVTPWKHGYAIYNALTEVKFEGLTGYVAFNRNGYRKEYTLDVMEVSLEKGPVQVGYFKDREGLNMTPNLPPQRNTTTESKNRTRVVTTILSAPYLMLKKEVEDGSPRVGNDRYEGYCADLAEEVSKIVNFDYMLKPVKDGVYGAKMTNGTWNGMVGELTRKEADLAIAPLTISSQRERVIDFSKPFMSLGISIMIKKPEKQKPGVFSFLDPLSYEIWMSIIFAYIGVSVVLFLVSRFSPYEWHIEDAVNGPQVTNDFTMLNSLWFSLGAFMQQGCDISPRSMSGRIVGSVWWFFTLIIISSYTANLAAFLTVERMLTPIESADDLAKQTEISYGTLNDGSTKEFFKSSKIAVYERMWSYMKSAKPGVFEGVTDLGVERVRNSKGKYAFLLESTMNEYYNQKKPCNTMKVGGNLDSKGYGIATPLGSELREELSLAVLKLREGGVLQKLKKKWWYDKGECGAVESKDSTQSALTLSNVAGIFYILIGGLGLSMITSLLEFLYKSRMEARRRKTTFGDAMRSKARLSIRGSSDTGNGGVGSPLHKPSLTMNTLYSPIPDY